MAYFTDVDTNELKRLLGMKKDGLIDGDDFNEAKSVIVSEAKRRRLSAGSFEPSAVATTAPAAFAAASAMPPTAKGGLESQTPQAASVDKLFAPRGHGGGEGHCGSGCGL